MRRLMILLLSLTPLTAAIGCCITAGQCDCARPCDQCSIYGLNTGAAPTIHTENIQVGKAMPPAGE